MTLRLFAFFHLNMMFSSIPDERRPEIVEKAYWPLLDLPRRIGAPIGLEASGLTLEIVDGIDPSWTGALKRRIAEGRIELIGSGYAQLIGPLVPASVNKQNLRLGTEVYLRLLERKPNLALVNEQAYSGGLLPLYAAEGYQGVLMDWDNVAPYHPEWPQETRFRPRMAAAAGGSAMPLLWTQTLAFQRLQRYAHGEISLTEYLASVESFRKPFDRTLCLYSNDAEVFDVRPGRLHTEDRLDGAGEWDRIARAWSALAAAPETEFIAPSAAIARLDPGATPLRLECAAYPIPVKKQPKYNIARWAVSGRDNLRINARCERLTRALDARADPGPDASPGDWRALCRLWSSDFRTHIGDARWREFQNELGHCEKLWDAPAPAWPSPNPDARPLPRERFIRIETSALDVSLNARRGLAIQSMSKAGDAAPPMLVSLLHGHFHDIALQADWYTANAVFEALDGPKVTDLDWAEPATWACPDTGATMIETSIATRKGPIFKRFAIHESEPRLDVDMVFHWPDMGRGSLRVAHILLNPAAFDWPHLMFETMNGGDRPERFPLCGAPFDHSAPVSLQVSSTAGLGATSGRIAVGDGRRSFEIQIDRTVAPMLTLVQFQQTSAGPFCRFMLSASETDDTRKTGGGAAPLHIRYALVLKD
jgi:hypothetical protein